MKAGISIIIRTVTFMAKKITNPELYNKIMDRYGMEPKYELTDEEEQQAKEAIAELVKKGYGRKTTEKKE